MYIAINSVTSNICHKLYYLYCDEKENKDFDMISFPPHPGPAKRSRAWGCLLLPGGCPLPLPSSPWAVNGGPPLVLGQLCCILQSTSSWLKKWCHEAGGVDPPGAGGYLVDVGDSPVDCHLLKQANMWADWAAGACGSSMIHPLFMMAVSLITYAVEAALNYLCHWGCSWLLMPLRRLLIIYAAPAHSVYAARASSWPYDSCLLKYICRWGRS